MYKKWPRQILGLGSAGKPSCGHFFPRFIYGHARSSHSTTFRVTYKKFETTRTQHTTNNRNNHKKLKTPWIMCEGIVTIYLSERYSFTCNFFSTIKTGVHDGSISKLLVPRIFPSKRQQSPRVADVTTPILATIIFLYHCEDTGLSLTVSFICIWLIFIRQSLCLNSQLKKNWSPSSTSRP